MFGIEKILVCEVNEKNCYAIWKEEKEKREYLTVELESNNIKQVQWGSRRYATLFKSRKEAENAWEYLKKTYGYCQEALGEDKC